MNQTDLDLELDARLSALEARAPGAAAPPDLVAGRRRGRFAAPMALASVLVLAVVATAAGAVVVRTMAEGREGIQNPGQPLAGATMECMTPPAAAAFLAAHGFPNVVWQVESGEVLNAAGGKGPSSTVNQSRPPEHGFVIPGAILSDGQVHMVVDQRTGATGVGACFGQPMP